MTQTAHPREHKTEGAPASAPGRVFVMRVAAPAIRRATGADAETARDGPAGDSSE